MRDFIDLIENEYVVLDGAMGTRLQEFGLTAEDLPEEWNLSHSDVVMKIHSEYLEAGAQIIETNTFGGNPLKLSMKKKESLIEDVNKKGVEIAKSAVEQFLKTKKVDDVYVAGSVGPTGKIVDMDITADEAENAFSVQAEVLDKSGVDLFIVETMMHLKEAISAVRGIKRISDKPVIVSMVFNKTKKGEFRTLFGNTPDEAVESLLSEGVVAVGTNCGLIDEYVEVVRRMREKTDKPIIMYPNAGLPRLVDGKTVFDQKPEDMIKYLDASIDAGATIIGGCCGTTPEYIKMIAGRIKGKKR